MLISMAFLCNNIKKQLKKVSDCEKDQGCLIMQPKVELIKHHIS
jgi:hypothetical protein